MKEPQSGRRPLIAANWKMHLLRQDASGFCRTLRSLLPSSPNVELVIFPGFTLLPTVAQELVGSTVAWGGQDLHQEAKGAHTGDVSGEQLADIGCSWVLCGHSERRQNHRESDRLVGEKALSARRHGLQPLLCVGETSEERQSGRTFEVLDRQLEAALAHRPQPFVLAYEPVWAIGTGETATPALAQKAHEHLRMRLGETLGKAWADEVRILYGGSVKPGNAAELGAEKDIDGFLVGGASLDPASFSGIISNSGFG
ncbi:MAG: triose-phosphate isomerase [Deltaproteobacteria bacterium]|nr:triose-phosphate isomerase [Deltaproteobacteria bacterium]